MSTAHPARRSKSPLSRPLIEPPTTMARFARVPVNWSPRSFRLPFYPIYDSEQLWRNSHGPDHARQAGREKGKDAVAGGHCRRVRAGKQESESLRRLDIAVGK